MKSIELKEIPVQRAQSNPGDLPGPTHLSVSLTYRDGKTVSYGRGYYIEVRPQIHDGNFIRTVVGRNVAHTLHMHHLCEAKRFSKNKLVKLATDEAVTGQVSSLIDDALQHNGLLVVSKEQAA